MREFIGKTVKDKVTGFTGEITAYAIYSTGVDRAQVESLDSTGRPIEWWTDVDRLEFVE